MVPLTPLYCRQILWQLQQRWRLQNRPAFQARRAGCELHTCPGASVCSPERAENQSDLITDREKHSFCLCFVCVPVWVCVTLHELCHTFTFTL